MFLYNKLNYFKERKEPQKHIKYKEIIKFRTSKEKKEKLYEFYKCDYCGTEIVIKKQKHEMTGGIVLIPKTLSKCGNITLALCNCCLNKALKEFSDMDKYIRKGEKNNGL